MKIKMKRYRNDVTGFKLRRRLDFAIKNDSEIILDFEGADNCELQCMKEILRKYRHFRENNTVVKVQNAPDSLATLLLLLNINNKNIFIT